MVCPVADFSTLPWFLDKGCGPCLAGKRTRKPTWEMRNEQTKRDYLFIEFFRDAISPSQMKFLRLARTVNVSHLHKHVDRHQPISF